MVALSIFAEYSERPLAPRIDQLVHPVQLDEVPNVIGRLLEELMEFGLVDRRLGRWRIEGKALIDGLQAANMTCGYPLCLSSCRGPSCARGYQRFSLERRPDLCRENA